MKGKEKLKPEAIFKRMDLFFRDFFAAKQRFFCSNDKIIFFLKFKRNNSIGDPKFVTVSDEIKP